MTNFESGGLSRRGFLKGVGAVALEAAAGSFINNEVQAGDMSLLRKEIEEIEDKIGLNNTQINTLLALSADDIGKINNGEEARVFYGKRRQGYLAYKSGVLSEDTKGSIATGAVMGGLMGGSLMGAANVIASKNEDLTLDTVGGGVGGAVVGSVFGGLAADFSTGILQNFIESVKNKNEKITDEDIIKEVKRLKAENESLSKTLEPKVELLDSQIKAEQIRKKEIEKRVK